MARQKMEDMLNAVPKGQHAARIDPLSSDWSVDDKDVKAIQYTRTNAWVAPVSGHIKITK